MSFVKEFDFSLRVPYAHIDKMGIVYYANYFVYFEMARADLLREAGLPYGELEERGIMLPVVEAHCDYKKSAHYDDLLVVHSFCRSFRGPRLRIDYEVRRDTDLLVSGHTEHVCMNPSGRVLRPDAELRRIFDGQE